MRRISVVLACAAILLVAVVGYTYKLRADRAKEHRQIPSPLIESRYKALANNGWKEDKDDPVTNRPMFRVRAKSFKATDDPSTFDLNELTLRLYDKTGGSYTYVRSGNALFDEKSKLMKSPGAVFIIRNVPADKDAENAADVAHLVKVETSGVSYETKTGKADTDQPATFTFSGGSGHAVGLSYDPNTGDLHLKSQIALDFNGNGPAEKRMHIEAGDLVYKEREQKVYLSPWSKLQRQTTTIKAQNSLVTLQDGILHQIDSDHAAGTDVREDKRTAYSADKMTALFDEDGELVNIVGQGAAKVVSTQATSRTVITGSRADLRFVIDSKQVNGVTQNESNLHLVLAQGKAVAESDPLPQPGVQLGEKHILRSEQIELEMKPGGKDVQEIRAPVQAQLEFKPNQPDQSHRILDASHLRILYGAGSYIDHFLAWNVATHTDKPQPAGKEHKPSLPALTWSDQLAANFEPNSNQVANIEQVGNFRYQEGSRKATAKRAVLEQIINRITLLGNARVADDSGSSLADEIIMNQANGDMDATGHVVSTHAPNTNQKPGTSMLDNTKTMQAKADQMQTRDNNTKIFYDGHAVMWQGANRISANVINIDREEETLHASGEVVSELVDSKSDSDSTGQVQVEANAPTFTVVHAPELSYRDDIRVADYSGGVRLDRAKMMITSSRLQAFLSPKNGNESNESSLDHAFADGDVKIFDVVASGRTRTGTSQHCEYYARQDKVVLNGGSPQMLDSYKGVTKGRQLTYFNQEDRLIVEGEKKALVYTQMKKR